MAKVYYCQHFDELIVVYQVDHCFWIASLGGDSNVYHGIFARHKPDSIVYLSEL
jgi:hypothetical protein